MVEVICGGIIIADTVVKPVDKLPPRGTLAFAGSIDLCVGGCASNTATALARLGIPTAVAGRVGNDFYGEFLRESLGSERLDLSALHTDKKLSTSSVCALVASDGERTFLHTPGANAALTDRDFRLADFGGARITHCAGILLCENMRGQTLARLMKRARKSGMITSLDTVWDGYGRWLDFVEPALPFIDYFFTNDSEGRKITGRGTPAGIADFLLCKGVGTAIVKKGENGSMIARGKTTHDIPAFETGCIDSTGAGDAYVAGFLYGILKGWPLDKCGIFGSAVAALSTNAPGATTALPSLPKATKAVKKWYPGFDKL